VPIEVNITIVIVNHADGTGTMNTAVRGRGCTGRRAAWPARARPHARAQLGGPCATTLAAVWVALSTTCSSSRPRLDLGEPCAVISRPKPAGDRRDLRLPNASARDLLVAGGLADPS
jgi:hypothetical protein